MIKIGVIGCGYWGPNLIRNFQLVSGCGVRMVCDLRIDRREFVEQRYPGVLFTDDVRELMESPEIDAIVIATPVSTHFELALQALQAGKHVLVEKPLASSSEEILRLIDEAERRRLILMVDHTFVYTGAVRKMKSLVEDGVLGDLYYYDAVRVNLGLFQHDVNVLWDLAVHDLSILDYVLNLAPCGVSVTGISHAPGGMENIAYLTLFFPEQIIAHVHVNWLAPTKIRRTLLGGSQKMIVYDDLEPSEKVKVYDKGVQFYDPGEVVNKKRFDYRIGDMWAPQVDLTEALSTEAHHFIQCIEKNERPLTDGIAGLRVVRILEAATQSMAQQGRVMDLELVGITT